MPLTLFDLTGRRALVTGSSEGIGLALARGVAEAGATAVLNGRDAAKLERAAAALRRDGLQVETAAFDVTDSQAVEAAVAHIESGSGPIDILFNNAGVNLRAPLTEMPDETWRQVMATNLDSAFYCTRSVARRMIPRRRGKIVNTCSVMSTHARAITAPYGASKGALMMLTRTMCAEWAGHGIQANAIAPGFFATALTAPLRENQAFNDWLCQRTPAGRWGELPELMGAAIFLASDASSYVNVHLLHVDGGMSAVL